MIRVLPSRVRLDGTALVALLGAPAARAVAWSCSSGSIAGYSTITDDHGRAFAKFTPAAEGAATIEVSYGA